MQSFVLSVFVLAAASSAMASPTCNAPKEKWQPEAAFRQNLESQGYKIKTFKVTKQQCYEIYGTDKTGKKVEIYFDPVSGKPLLQK